MLQLCAPAAINAVSDVPAVWVTEPLKGGGRLFDVGTPVALDGGGPSVAPKLGHVDAVMVDPEGGSPIRFRCVFTARDAFEVRVGLLGLLECGNT